MKTRLLAALFALSVLGATAAVVLQSRGLQERIAVHFDAAGKPNGWGSRDAEVMVFAAFLTVGVPLFISGICYAGRFFGPEGLNVPNATYWRSPEHYPEARAILFRFGLLLGTIWAWLGPLLHARIVAANRVIPPRLDGVEYLGIYFVAGSIFAAAGLWLRFRRVP